MDKQTIDREGVRETYVRALYESWPHTVISLALADATGLPIGAVISWEKAVSTGADMSALYRYADAILALPSPAVPSDDGLREMIDAGLRSFCSDEPDFDISPGMRRKAAEHILAQPWAATLDANAVRSAALEEAAKVADRLLYHPHPDLNDEEHAWNDAACRISTDIRALKPTLSGEPLI